MLKKIFFIFLVNYKMLKLTYKVENFPKKVIMTELSKSPAKYSLIWLHGLGSSPLEFIDFFNTQKILPKNFRIVLLQAPLSPVTLNGGMPSNSWFDIKDLNFSSNSINFSDVEKSSKKVIEEIEQEIKLVKSSKNVFLGGFSQGASISLNVGLNFEQNLGGVISCSGILFPKTDVRNLEVPVLATHGDFDDVIRYDKTVLSYEPLKERKGFQFFTMVGQGHTIDFDVVRLMKAFFERFCK